MTLIQYILAILLGCLAALIVGSIMSMTGASTTIDAWMLSFTISGHDVGDRMTMFVRSFIENSSINGITGFSYLIGHSISEEVVKFLMFYVAFRVFKPSSIREIILTGISVGIGFALCETVAYYDTTPFFHLQSIFLRSIGHGLFTGLLAMLF
jgi:RsiW-degrading membrane proteinase PrsW (M82 family)